MFHRLPRNLDQQYAPLYWLAALGAGGLTVSFFMWLLFWVPRGDNPVPVFSNIIQAFATGSTSMQIAIVIAWIGILYFAWMHLRLLFWNIREYRRFLRTQAFAQMHGTRAEIQRLAAPLTVAMSINVGFVLGMVFVPRLWDIVEALFPLAMLAFLLVGSWALRMLGDYWGRMLTEANCDCLADNSLAQSLPAFTLAMVGVGLAAPAAMSETPGTVAASLVLSSFFMISAVLTGAVMLVLGVRAMLEQSANPVSAPSLWIGIPVLTIIGITLVRQTHGIEHHFGAEAGGVETLGVLTYLLVTQIAFGLLGWSVMKRYRYFQRFVFGEERSAGSYTLICPGVALSVMLHFFVNAGLTHHGVIDKFSIPYWTITGVAILVQAATIALVLQLNSKHFRVRSHSGQAQAAANASSA